MDKSVYKVIGWVTLFIIIISSISYVLGWFSEASQVAKDEFGVKASLKKYEWFKDASETIVEKRETIKIYENNLINMTSDYDGIKRKDWDRLDKQQFNQWALEVAGLKATLNKVIKEYNSQSSKFNWGLYNSTELPTSYELYISK